MFAGYGGLHRSDGLGLVWSRLIHFLRMANPNNFLEETVKTHFKGFIRRLYCLHLVKTFLKSFATMSSYRHEVIMEHVMKTLHA